ncbi:MAG: LysR substrate-binding domain-containing protein, partial [Clostridiales bacterium]|nr:LysR substrate-binding domain-containing protein [Clostridiales bacterium]
DLGTQLFKRSRTDWGLTEAGRIYLEGARAVMNIKKDTYNRIYDQIQTEKHLLTIGLTPGRGLRMFTDIYPELHRRQPHLHVKPVEMRVYLQQQAITRGELDIGFITLPVSERTGDSYLTLNTEEMNVIVPIGHPLARRAAPPGEPPALLDLSDLRYEPFVLMDRNSPLRTVCNAIFREAGFEPNILFETNNTAGIVAMVESTLCCGIIPNYYVKTSTDKVACFCLASHPTWDMAVSWRKGSYLSEGAKEFINLAKDYWNGGND